MARAQRKAFVDYDGCEVGVQHGGAKCVFQASDNDRFVDKGIDRTPQLAPFVGERGPITGRETGDDQGFEIGTARGLLPEHLRHQIGRLAIAVIIHTPVAGMLAEGPRRQGLRQPCRQGKRSCRIASRGRFPQGSHQLQARIAVELLGHGEIGQRRVVFCAVSTVGPRLCGIHEFAPVVCPSPGAGKKLIDALLCGLGVLGHVSLPVPAMAMPDRDPPPGRSFDPSQRSCILDARLLPTTQNAAFSPIKTSIVT